jgi:hypothetical protein
MIQGQGMVWQNTTEGKIPLILIPRDKLSQILYEVHYTEVLKFEIPLYSDSSPVTNEAMKKTLTLLRHSAALLKQGNNEGALVDVRKSLTNYLLANRGLNNERILDKSIHDDWINKSPTDVTAIYEDIILRIQEGLRIFYHCLCSKSTHRQPKNLIKSRSIIKCTYLALVILQESYCCY